MNKKPLPESVSEMLKKMEREPFIKPLSCLGIFVVICLILYVTVPILFVWFVNDFFAGLAPKQADVDRADAAIKRINATMDEFEQSLQPIRTRIEMLEERVPEREDEP